MRWTPFVIPPQGNCFVVNLCATEEVIFDPAERDTTSRVIHVQGVTPTPTCGMTKNGVSRPSRIHSRMVAK